MITLSLTNGDAWLLASAFAANFTLGVYHLLVVLETIKQRPGFPLFSAIILGLAYAGPPALLALSFARIGHIL